MSNQSARCRWCGGPIYFTDKWRHANGLSGCMTFGGKNAEPKADGPVALREAVG